MFPQEKRKGISELGVILIIVCTIAACLGVYLLLFYFEGVFHVGEIQAAVDQQCGQGRVTVEWQKVYTDPFVEWSHDQFSCRKLSGKIDCFCGE
jgi:hypothetical protein